MGHSSGAQAKRPCKIGLTMSGLVCSQTQFEFEQG